ncbi:programmed cell death 1 ligand 1 [Hoplias malabaricus]|uniref:programmed cell death 1 ligand 1 n=1 Tax=Hoplias malabaricus TaxID=27720 RepID=UPI0034625AB4
MKRHAFTFLLAAMWPSLQALFTVKTEQESYEGEFGKSVRLVCIFSFLDDTSGLTVYWNRLEPFPPLEVYRLERGKENSNFTDPRFKKRAKLVMEELKNHRAVLELSQLQINDTGTYRCIVKQQEADFKKTSLTVRAPYSPVKKSVRHLGNGEVELSCESQGFPMANMAWKNGEGWDKEFSNSSNVTTEGIFNLTSRVIVGEKDTNNYTCSFTVEGKEQQSATFVLPRDFTERSKWSNGYVAICVIAVMCVGFAITSVILHRRKKGQKNKDPSLGPKSVDYLLPNTLYANVDTVTVSSEVFGDKVENLREVLRQRYAELNTTAEEKRELLLQHTLVYGDNQELEIHSIIPGVGETVLLEQKEGNCKPSLAQQLASSWADDYISDPFNVRQIQLVILVIFNGAKGDLFQVVKSHLPSEAGLVMADVKTILLGKIDSLLILDGYKEGNRDLDESLIAFLKERSACRVLITAQRGQHRLQGATVTKTLQVHSPSAGT